MRTISTEVTNYIKEKPFLSTALSQGIINLTALSRQIKSDIEKRCHRKVQTMAIVMALKRISDTLEFTSTHLIIKTLRRLGDITVRSSLIDYNFKLSETILANQAKALSRIRNTTEVFYATSRGVGETNIVVSKNIESIIDEIFESEKRYSKRKNLSAITIKLPEENVSVPGVYYFIFQRLSWENINIVEVISTSNEFTLLMTEDVVTKAFETIRKLKSL